MSSRPLRATRPKQEPLALHERAAENLRYIRETMERATSLTAISGLGFVLIGLTAVAAAWLAAVQPTPVLWSAVWLAELVVAGLIGLGTTARKARAQGERMRSYAGRKLILAFSPPMAVGGLLSVAALAAEAHALIPGIWLGLYGAGVMTAGAYSVRIVPLMGAAFIGMAALALLRPLDGDVMLALGMGGLHVLFGLVIWRRYGG